MFSSFARVRARIADQRGFGLVEAMVAIGVLFMAMLALVYTAVVGFGTIALSRQRTAADGVADQIQEQIHALTWTALSNGLSDSESGGLTSDPNILSCGGILYFKNCPAVDPVAEQIIHSSTGAGAAPLVPHRGTFGPPTFPETYSWSAYVTQAKNVPAAGALRITVIVGWAPAATAGARSSITTQTLIAPPKTAFDSQTDTGSSTTFLFATGGISHGNITVAPTSGGTVSAGISGLASWNSMTLDLQYLDATVQTQSLRVASADTVMPGGRDDAGGTFSTAGEPGAAAFADNDSTSGYPSYSNPAAVSTAGASIAIPSNPGSGVNSLQVVEGSGAHSGATVSATNAKAQTPCNAQTNNQPCAYSTYTPGTGADVTLKGSAAASSGAAFTLAYVQANAGSTGYGYARRNGNGANGEAIVTVVRNTDNLVNLGGVFGPSNTPNGWAGYWVQYLDSGATQTVQTDAGGSSVAPTATPAGSLRLWNGSGYNTYPLTSWKGAITDQTGSCSASSLCVTEVHSCVNVGGIYFKFDMSGALAIQASYTSQTPAGASGTTQRTDALAMVGSPLTGTMRYQITKYSNSACTAQASPVSDLTMTVDLGSLIAHSTYSP